MESDPETWLQRVLDTVVQAAADVLPDRASVSALPPTASESSWRVALVPVNDAAAPLDVFVEEASDSIDNFAAGSRSTWFELWEAPDVRLDRLRQIVRAVIEGEYIERVSYVGDDPVEVELTLLLPEDGETTYSRSTPPSEPGGSQRFDTFSFDPY